MAASAALILPESPSMKKAVPLINAIDTGRFPRLLSRILQKLHLKAESSFSEEEEEKLQAAFSLEKQELHLVLETISFVLEQLETVGWQLNLQMAHSAQAKLQSPQAVLQLGVSKEDAKFQTVSSDHIHPTSPTPRSTSPHPNYASSFICPTWRKFSWNSITRSCSISTTSWRPYKRSWTPSHDVLEDWLPSPSHSGHLTLSH
ncbi:COMM domain-containing protein 10 isoform 3 [Mus musculus]|uniref:COMM domain-containing protein 10 isoform 3 n=1 Tax=Mus musculus TaxID=10090 RepID=UPI0003D75F5C|nr:COMM domain-containing protein 10 isoform 3 [Mus musculus]|eukprot:XP_006526288.1 PREDICTED: COMM domain-containing protein 10 isoform X2 [Mus musculus]